MKTMKKTVLLFLLAGITFFSAGTLQAKTYTVGDLGPGGGWIFWAKPSPSEGWQYLEVAPEDQGLAVWGCYGKEISGAEKRDFSEGRQNTEAIMQACPGEETAAKLARNYRGGGKTDWYLSSLEELNRISISLEKSGKANFQPAYYWTSSQESSSSYGQYKAFIKHLGILQMITANKYSQARVRAVRAF